MVLQKLFTNRHHFRNLLPGFIITAFLLFITLPAWTQNDEGKPEDKSQLYPDLKPAGFLQTHFNAYDRADRPANFLIKRARMGIKGSLSKNIQMNLIAGAVEPPNNSPALVNAFADFTIHPLLKIRAGQFLVPFGLEGPEPIFRNPAIERAFSTRNLNTFLMFRDIGVMAFGEHSFVNYSVAVVNGNGANITETLYQKDIIGRLDFSATGGLMAGMSGHVGTFESDDAEMLLRQRWGTHAEYTNKPLHLRAEFMLHDQEISPGTREQAFGGYFLGTYKIAEKWETMGRLDYHEPDNKTHIYQGLTLGTNYQLNQYSQLSLNGIVYTEDESNSPHYMLHIQMQLVL